MISFSKIELVLSVGFNPDWGGPHSGKIRNQTAYGPPTYEVTREADAPVYVVRHIASGDEAEIPAANVKVALRAPSAAVEINPYPIEGIRVVSDDAVSEPDPIADVPTAVAKRGPGRPRKTPEAQ